MFKYECHVCGYPVVVRPCQNNIYREGNLFIAHCPKCKTDFGVSLGYQEAPVGMDKDPKKAVENALAALGITTKFY